MRQTSKVVATTCAALCLGLVSVSAQSPAARPDPTAPLSRPGSSSKPFQRLFTPPSDDLTRSQLLNARQKLKDIESGSARRFICGMPVLPADATVDPEFEVPLRDPRTRFSMRIAVPVCR